MKNNLTKLIPLLVVSGLANSLSASEFKMHVEEVDLLNGMIMRGISLTGPVAEGCLANEDEYQVLRGDKVVVKEITRIVNIEGLKSSEEFTGKTVRGEKVSLFIPDAREGTFKVGDVVVSKNTSCEDPTVKAVKKPQK